MIQFKKLRLTGFKSFVDHSELLINSGLTGVVGPNGCGKSNLVEALRWVMGETSAKQMRGGEMDDVIFAGSANRPARNVAEVALVLDNTNRSAPALFNEDPELSVTRRIERAKGSNYKVNGRDVRARDVQLLFADAATGARSTAMVSQGRIGAIINAKPQARRMILEEAAGISGLHSRRHEAELRLRAAENNLSRLDDILITLDTQQKNLQKQARQASRYRTISERIKKAESLLFHMKWGQALDELDVARKAYKATEARVTELTTRAAEASKLQAEAASKLPALREEEVKCATILQRLSIEKENLNTEEKRLAELKTDLERRLAQTRQDLQRESEFSKDAEAANTRLEREQAHIEEQSGNDTALIKEAEEKRDGVKAEVSEQEQAIAVLSDEVAALEAQKRSLNQRKAELERQLERQQARASELSAQKDKLLGDKVPDEDIHQAALRVEEASKRASELEANLSEAQVARETARRKVQDVLLHVRECEAVLAKLEAEEDALAELLDPKDDVEGQPLLDEVSVDPGYEAALGAALGDDINAPRETQSPLHWVTPPHEVSDTALPASTAPLSRHAQAPIELRLRLSQVGVVDTPEQAASLQGELKQGQRLVSLAGGMWRWDGFVSLPGAPSQAAQRLKQKNRLNEIRAQWEGADKNVQDAKAQFEQAQQGEQQADETEKSLRSAINDLTSELTAARKAQSDLAARQSSFESRIQSVEENQARLQSDLGETRQALSENQSALSELPENEAGRAKLSDLRSQLEDKRNTLLEHQGIFERIRRESESRQTRLKEIAQELKTWQARAERASQHSQDLEVRVTELSEQHKNVDLRPDEIEAKRQKLLDALNEAEAKRQACADRLQEGENHLRDLDGQARAAEQELASHREERVRQEAQVEQGKQLCMTLAERIRERLDCKPEDLRDLAEMEEGAELPDMDAAEKRVERLHRERDTMGPVNLRAESELEELSEQVETMNSERADLLKAIEKLRQGIAELNREGRERLLSSFNEVNRHFEELFTRLFGGGTAHLELIEDEDPLQAGLEIMASPPGKRMQILSLLSGGEQALTALALLFGVFLTNPAPICVLDEVDAPLDDANVDRFCTLLEEMAANGSTRFLIITHHRMTMARMQRLFGVTMTERGVSQLVSVDLQKAEELVES